jgi:hypothetical protein
MNRTISPFNVLTEAQSSDSVSSQQGRPYCERPVLSRHCRYPSTPSVSSGPAPHSVTIAPLRCLRSDQAADPIVRLTGYAGA